VATEAALRLRQSARLQARHLPRVNVRVFARDPAHAQAGATARQPPGLGGHVLDLGDASLVVRAPQQQIAEVRITVSGARSSCEGVATGCC
jgi:hypothetical protein